MPANYVLIGEYTTSVATANVSFINIPQSGYTDLKVVISARTTSGGPIDMYGLINGDTTASAYNFRQIQGSGSTVTFATGAGAYMLWGTAAGAGETANTYASTEIYLANYLSSNTKLGLSDSVTENNATTAYITTRSLYWSGTAAINSLSFYNNSSLNFAAGSTFSLYGIANFGTTPTVLPKASGGDIITNDGTYWYHAFLSSGVFTPSSNLTADAIIVGAGGGGGADVGGGAGSGRVYGLTGLSMASATNYACTIGAGAPTTVPALAGIKGTNSSLIGGVLSYTSLAGGGGQGRQQNPNAANDGWSGGGGSYDSVRGPTAGNGGFAGGTTSNPGTTNCQSGGGGGAGEAGNTDAAGEGGDGVNTYSTWATATATGVSGFYGGGGGGGFYSGFSVCPGGSGGGGGGGNNNAPGLPGTANTGSGGGGGGSSQNGGAGGSGIVIVRYTMA